MVLWTDDDSITLSQAGVAQCDIHLYTAIYKAQRLHLSLFTCQFMTIMRNALFTCCIYRATLLIVPAILFYIGTLQWTYRISWSTYN